MWIFLSVRFMNSKNCSSFLSVQRQVFVYHICEYIPSSADRRHKLDVVQIQGELNIHIELAQFFLPTAVKCAGP